MGNSLNSIAQRLSPVKCERIEKKRGKESEDNRTLLCRKIPPTVGKGSVRSNANASKKKGGKESEDDRTLRCRESLQGLENARLSPIDPNLVSIESSVECGPVRKKKLDTSRTRRRRR